VLRPLLVLVLLAVPTLARAWSPTITWNTYLGGSGDDTVKDLVTGDSLGNVVVVGETNSAGGFPMATNMPDAASKRDVFVAFFGANGSLNGSLVFGGSGDDEVSQVRFVPGGLGDVYVVGTLKASTSGIIRASPSGTAVSTGSSSQSGGSDAFLARISSAGVLRWLIFVGGDGTDEGLALVADANNVYVAGRTQSASSSFPGTSSGKRGDGFDAFITQVKVSNMSAPVVGWTRFLGTNDPLPADADDAAYALVLNGSALYVAGTVGSRISNTEPSLVVREDFHEGSDDGFVAKLDAQGQVVWFSNVGSGDTDEVRALLAVPGSEDVVVVGHTNSPDFRTSQSSGSDFDVFVSRMTSDGTLVESESARVGGDGNEKADGHAAVDAFGNVYVGGRTSSSSKLAKNAFDFTFQTNNGTNSDGFVAMVDASAQQVIWASYVGATATQDEWVVAFSAGPRGQLTLGGYSDAPDLQFLSTVGDKTSPNGGVDGLIFRLEVDTTAPSAGDVVGSLPGGTFSATWGFADTARNFSDPETGIVSYTWGIGTSPGSDDVRFFQKETSDKTYTFASDVQAEPGKTYYVTVIATNAVGLTTQVSSNGFSLPGTVEPGTDAGTGTGGQPDSDPGAVPGGELLSPVGWGCGSTGGGGAAGALALVALGLLMLRRARTS
jgi:hypothetical protein